MKLRMTKPPLHVEIHTRTGAFRQIVGIGQSRVLDAVEAVTNDLGMSVLGCKDLRDSDFKPAPT